MAFSNPIPEDALRASTFLGQLGEPGRRVLQQVARARVFPGDIPLIREGDDDDHVIVVRDGWATVTATARDGHKAMLALLGPGDIAGEAAALHSGRGRGATVTALTVVHAWIIPAARFQTFLTSTPEVWRILHDVALQRLEAAERRTHMRAQADAVRRLAPLLVELAETHGIEVDDGYQLPPLTQDQLASWLGVTRLTVARGLREMRRWGLLRTSFRKIVVTDLDVMRFELADPAS